MNAGRVHGEQFGLAELMARLDASLPDLLVPPAARARVRGFAAGWPQVWRWAVLESPLGSDHDDVDVMTSLVRPGQGAHPLGAWLREADPIPAPLAAARPFLEAWAGRGPGMEPAQVAWLEWDADRFDDPVPLQMAMTDATFPFGRDDAGLSPGAIAAATAACVQASDGTALPRAVLDRLAQATARLPPSGRVLAVASLAPRGRDALRVFVQIAPGDAIDWLAAVGWPGELAEARSWVRRLVRPWEPVFLQVELAPGFAPYLGLEPAQSSPGFVERVQRKASLDAMVVAGVARADRAAALHAWASRAPLPWEGRAIWTGMHCKVVTEGRGWRAKGYLHATVRAGPCG